MFAPLQGCSMQEEKVWWSVVVACMMIGVANVGAAPEPVEEYDVTINTAKLFHIVDERFLSLTIDPAMLLFGKEFSSGRTRILNMVRGLTPAYLRLGGPDCNHYNFMRSHMNGARHENYAITEMHWVDINNFAQEAGFKLVACLNILNRVNGVWDSRNSLDLIAFSDEMGYNVTWELGYEIQELGTDISAAQYGQDVARLRNILDAFPRYQHSLIIGPDITRFKKQEDIDFLKNYFNEGGSVLNGITWHPEFTHQDNNSMIKSENVVLEINQLMHDWEVLNNVLGVPIAKKPLWIGDRQSVSSQGWFLDALKWADKLGVAAQIGVQVIMQQPHLYGLFEPTPYFWVSLLHKALVGRVVLDVKHGHSNNTHIHMYCHCTNHHTAGLFGEAVSYKSGDITCFGISHLSTKVKITLKLGSTGEWTDEVHQYLLTSAGNGEKLRETLMNGQPLNLGDIGTLPILSPDTYRTGQNIAVTLPPTSIGFWVFTGVQAEPCLAAPFESTAEASNNKMYHNIRSTKSRQYLNLSQSDQEANSHIRNKSRGYGFNDMTGQYKQFSGKITEDNRSETEKGDFESSNTKMIEEFDMNVRSKSIRRKRDERERTAQGRYKRNVSEGVKYLIPGLQPDYSQANNGITTKNLIGRRNRGDRLQETPKISVHESNIHSLLHESHRHVSSEDVDDGLPGISSGRLKVNSFPSGGIYFQRGDKSSEKRNDDYDYVDKDENVYEEYAYVPSEIEYFHRPTEYFEVFQKSGAAANEKFAGYRGELSEAESIAFLKQRNQEWEQRYDDHDRDYNVIQEQGLTAQDNRKAKSVATRMPNTYYTETNKQDSSDEGEDFEVQRRIKGKYKIDIKKDTSNRRKVEKRNHENDYPDLSSLIAKLKKDAATALGVLSNKYNNNTDVPAEQAEITKSSQRINETATTEQNRNNSSTAEEYYQEGYRTRRLGNENSEMTNQRNDRNVTQHANHKNYNEPANHESFNNTQIASSSHGNVQFSKERPRKISHKVVYGNGRERTNSDTRHNHYKQDSKTRLIEKSFQRTAEDSYEDDEKESRASKQRTGKRTENSENNERNITDDWYVQINPTDVSEADSEDRVMKTFSRKIKNHNQQNIVNSRDTDKVRESVSAVKEQEPIESIDPNYIMKPSRSELRNPHRIGSAPGGTVTQKLVPIEGQSEEESDIQYMKHSSRTDIMTDESKETTETDDKQEEAMARKMKANKSRQTNQVIIRMPTSNKEARHRVRRDVPSHLPILEALKKNRHMWNKNTTALEKETKSEKISDSNNAELQMKSQNIKENNQQQTANTNVPITTMIKSYEDLQLDHSTQPSVGKNADHSTQMYNSLNTYKESSDNEYEKYRELTTEVSTNPQQKVRNTLMDRNHQEYKESGTNKTYWELQSGGSVEYFMDPKQSKKEGNIKRELGSSLMFEPYTDTNIRDSMMIQAVTDGVQHQHASVLRTGSSAQEGKRQSATDISTNETAPPVLMDRNSESQHDTTQQIMIVNNEEGTTNMDEDKNAHKNRDTALIIKMYHENLEPASGVIRLPKATETHINLQHGPRKVTTGGINYNELISNKEKYKHTKSRIQTHEETGKTGVWNMGIPVKISRVPPADKSSILSVKVKPFKLEHKGTKMPQGLPSSVTFGNSNKELAVSETGSSVSRKKQHQIRWNQNQYEDTQLHASEGQYTEEGNLNVEGKHDGQRVGRPYEKTMQRYNETGQNRHSKLKTSSEQTEQKVIADVAKKTFGETVSLETLADNTASKRPSLKNNVKLYTANSDSTDVAPTEPPELSARNATKKFPTINDVRAETLANLKNIHDKMKKAEDKAFKTTHSTTGSRSVQQSAGDGESDNNGLVHKVNTVTSELKPKNEKEKEYSALSAEKGKTDFTEGKFRILSKKKETDVAHSKLEDITTNYISHGKDVTDPLVRSAKDTGHLKYIAAMKENLNLHGVDNTNYNIKLQPSTIPTTGNMRTHLEKKRLEILQALTAQQAKLKEDLLKLRVMAAEGKLKLPHHINRRDTTQNELTESLMSSSETKDSFAPLYIKNEDHIDSSNKDNPSMGSQNFGDIDSDRSSYTEKSNDKYYSQDIYKLLEQIFLPLSMITDMSDIQVPVLGSQYVYRTQNYSKHEILPSSYVSDKSLHNSGLDEVELSKLGPSGTIEDVKKHNNRCKTCDKHKNTLIFQPLTQDFGNNSELTLQPDNSNTAHIRSERAISYLFNDNILQPSTIANNKNPKIEGNLNGTYWLQNFFNNNSKSSEKKSQTEEINSNMYHNVITPVSNELIISDVAPNSNKLIGREKLKFNSEDTTPANSLHVTNMKLITDNQTKGFENVTNENGLANQTFVGISGNYLNNTINAAAHGEKGNNKINDALRNTSNDVNLQTNEINRQFRILHRFQKSQHEASTTKSGTEGNTVEIKSIPYKFHKHVLNSTYEPKYKNSMKYSNPHEQETSAESSDEFPSTLIKLHSRFSPSDESSNVIKEIFSVVPEEFTNINNKSRGIFESTVSHDAYTISGETSRTETEHSEVSKVPSDIMTHTNADILTEPNVNKQEKGSLIILQTYPSDNLNNLTGSKKSVITLEKKTHELELVPNIEEDKEYSDIVNRSTQQHKETHNGQQETDYIQREKKPTSTTGHIHTLIKNISNHIVKFFHNIPPWNYFSPELTIRPL